MLDYREHAKEYLPLFRGIKLLVLDNDGVMTPAQVHFFDQNTPVGTSFSVLDGYAIVRAKQLGLHIAIISGRANAALEARSQLLKIAPEDFHAGVSDKGAYLQELMQKYSLRAEEVAFMGDDFIDISAFKVVGLAITVPNRHPIVDRYVKYTTLNQGGGGAVREVCDLIIIANETPSAMRDELLAYWNS